MNDQNQKETGDEGGIQSFSDEFTSPPAHPAHENLKPPSMGGDDYMPEMAPGGLPASASQYHLLSLPVPGGYRCPSRVSMLMPEGAEVIDFLGGQGTPRVVFLVDDPGAKPVERVFGFVDLKGHPSNVTPEGLFIGWRGWVRGEPEVLAVEVYHPVEVD